MVRLPEISGIRRIAPLLCTNFLPRSVRCEMLIHTVCTTHCVVQSSVSIRVIHELDARFVRCTSNRHRRYSIKHDHFVCCKLNGPRRPGASETYRSAFFKLALKNLRSDRKCTSSALRPANLFKPGFSDKTTCVQCTLYTG